MQSELLYGPLFPKGGIVFHRRDYRSRRNRRPTNRRHRLRCYLLKCGEKLDRNFAGITLYGRKV